MPYSYSGTTLQIYDKTLAGLVVTATIDAGTVPTTASLFAKGAKVIDLSTGTVYLNTGTTAVPAWESNTTSTTGLGSLRTARAIYSFAVDGGAVSTITPVSTATLPAKAVILATTVNATTAAAGATATIAVGTSAGSSTTSLLAATAVASFSTNALLNGASTFAAPVKLTASGSITVTIAVAALTAGIIEVTSVYYVAAA